MKKIFSWGIWFFAAIASLGWAFEPGSSFGRKLFYFIALIMFGFLLIGCNADDGSASKGNNRNAQAPKSKSADAQATTVDYKTFANKEAYSPAGDKYRSTDMNLNIIKTHQRALPAVDNEFFTKTARYWKVNPLGHEGINGTPGVGLDSSGFDNSRIKAGQVGEKELAQMMCWLGIASKDVQTYWSLRLPDSDFDTDVDAIVSYNNNIILVDAKQYVAGKNLRYTYNRDGVIDVKDVFTGERVKQYSFSRNMGIALEKYSRFFPSAHVEGVVLLCPTRNGIAATDANLGICDGKLAVTQSWTYLKDLKADIDRTHGRTKPEFDRKLKSLLKS